MTDKSIDDYNPGKNPPSLLLADDDAVFCDVLARALSKRGYRVMVAYDADSAWTRVRNAPPDYAIVDLKMPGPSGLTLVKKLMGCARPPRILVLTGYASIATAIESIKLGAVHYLAKPADTEEILAALTLNKNDAAIPIDTMPLSVNRLEWEHIQKILNEHHGNISATARALNMHRRTLQRKLLKHPARH
ncbi:MAG: response regulator transcription factor [Burkholderiales bacterium]